MQKNVLGCRSSPKTYPYDQKKNCITHSYRNNQLHYWKRTLWFLFRKLSRNVPATVQQNARKINELGEKCAVTMNRLSSYMKSHRYAATPFRSQLDLREKR